jgi:hypothetical protein
MSGQLISMEKTMIYFSKNVDAQTKRRLVIQSGFQETTNIGKYLGVPLIGGAPRKKDFQHLIDKVRNKLSGWKASHLSFAGRVTLSKSVIQAIPVYSMMTTLIPKSCLAEIQKLQRRFIWGEEENKRKLHSLKWSTLISPKECGGLAIRDMSKMNEACIMKLGWSLRMKSDNLWCQVLRGKYARGSTELEHLAVRQLDSPLWKSISKVWADLSKFEAWTIGDGLTASCWNDVWMDNSTRLRDYAVNVPPNAATWRVHDLVDSNGHWKMEEISLILPRNILQKLNLILPPCSEEGPDIRYWSDDNKGNFTISSAYKMLCGFQNIAANLTWKHIWKLDVPERIRYFAWQYS